MHFKILRKREYDNDYIALNSNGDEVVVDVHTIEDFEPVIGNVYCDNNSSWEPYKNVFFPKTFDCIEENNNGRA